MTTGEVIALSLAAYVVAAIVFHGFVAFVNAAFDDVLGPWRSGELALLWPVMVCAIALGSVVLQFVRLAECVHAKATKLGHAVAKRRRP